MLNYDESELPELPAGDSSCQDKPMSEHMLADKPSSIFKPRCRQNPTEHLVAVGRWFCTYDRSSGLERRSFPPQYTDQLTNESIIGVFKRLLHEISGEEQLHKLLLVVTPSKSHTTLRKLHIYGRESRKHMGMISLSDQELEELQRYELLLKYELLFASQHMHLKLMAIDRRTISELFLRGNITPAAPACASRTKLFNQRKMRYMSSMNFVKTPKLYRTIAVQTRSEKPYISALRKPKIPVRMQDPEFVARFRRIFYGE